MYFDFCGPFDSLSLDGSWTQYNAAKVCFTRHTLNLDKKLFFNTVLVYRNQHVTSKDFGTVDCFIRKLADFDLNS